MNVKDQGASPRRFNAVTTMMMTLLAATLVPLAGFAAGESKEDIREPMSAKLSGLTGEEFEAAFLAFMVHHHRDGAGLAKLAQEKAQNGELKRMAAQMIKGQEAEIQQMTGWLKQWHGKMPYDYGMPEESVLMVLQDNLALRNAEGAEFDKAFCEVMARHHTGAIEMAKRAREKAPHKEVKELAQKIDELQSEDRKKLSEMRGK